MPEQSCNIKNELNLQIELVRERAAQLLKQTGERTEIIIELLDVDKRDSLIAAIPSHIHDIRIFEVFEAMLIRLSTADLHNSIQKFYVSNKDRIFIVSPTVESRRRVRDTLSEKGSEEIRQLIISCMVAGLPESQRTRTVDPPPLTDQMLLRFAEMFHLAIYVDTDGILEQIAYPPSSPQEVLQLRSASRKVVEAPTVFTADTLGKEVIRRLEIAGIPRGAAIVGSIDGIAQTINMHLTDRSGTNILSEKELLSYLKALKEYGLDCFLGPTIPQPSGLGSKMLSAIASDIARVPYPRTWAFVTSTDKNQSSIIRLHSSPRVTTEKGLYVIKQSGTSGSKGVQFVEASWKEIQALLPKICIPDTFYVVQEYVKHTQSDGRTRDHRLLIDTSSNAQIVAAADRAGRRGNKATNVSAGGEWLETNLSRRELNKLSPRIRSVSNGAIRSIIERIYATDIELAGEETQRVLDLYQEAGIIPHYGLISMDLILPALNKKQSLREAWVCEIHHFGDLPEFILPEIAEYIVTVIGNRPIVLTGNICFATFPVFTMITAALNIPMASSNLVRNAWVLDLLEDHDFVARYKRIEDTSYSRLRLAAYHREIMGQNARLIS